MIVKRMVMQLGDDGKEIEVEEDFEDGLPDPATEPDDRGDSLGDEFLEVDEDVVAALAGDDDGRSKMIPRERFDEVNTKSKTLKEENDALRLQLDEAKKTGTVAAATPDTAAAAAAAPAFDIDAKEEAYAEAITEGDVEGAKAIRKEIRTFERESLKAELRGEVAQNTAAATIKSRTDAVVSQAFTDFPQLDNKSATYDAVLVQKINRMQQSYVADGKPADEALAAAIADFMPAKTAEQNAAAAETKRLADAATKARNAKAAGAQPPGLGGVGVGARAVALKSDTETMTDAQFDALPEAEKKRLRGD